MASFPDLKRTFARYSASDWDAVLLRLAEHARDVQLQWPRKVDFSGLLPDSEIAILPLFFADAFGRIEHERFTHFLAGSRLLASAIVIADALFDKDLERSDQIAFLLRWHGVQFELERQLTKAFSPESSFWPAYRATLAEYLGCVATEWTYASRRRRLADMTHSECLHIALAKSSVSRVTIAGLRLLGDDASRADALLQSLDKYNLARQIWDDVQDWKSDVRSNLPTLVTVRLAATTGLDDMTSGEPDLAALARELHYGGHMDELLELARESLASAQDLADREKPLPWHALVDGLDRHVAALQRDLAAIVRRNKVRLGRRAVSA